MSDNWVVSTLENELSNWNDHLNEIWSLVSQTPESFRGGEIWTVIVSIHNALVGFSYGLLVLFFAMGVFRSAASFRELQIPEFALRHFIRFLLAKVAVGSSLELITAIYKICGGVVSTVMGGIGSAISTTATLPDKIVEAIEDVSFLESIPLWLVSLLGSLLITVLSFVLILTVYGRFFKIFIYTAIAPLPLRSYVQNRSDIPQKLCRGVHGGRGHCAVLRDLLGVPVRRQYGAGRITPCGHNGLAIHRAAHVQYAGADRSCQRL